MEVTDAIRPGVVSIPHGWGHDLDGRAAGRGRRHAGVNSNLLADETLFDPISGNAVLNGIPVEVRAWRSPRSADLARSYLDVAEAAGLGWPWRRTGFARVAQRAGSASEKVSSSSGVKHAVEHARSTWATWTGMAAMIRSSPAAVSTA